MIPQSGFKPQSFISIGIASILCSCISWPKLVLAPAPIENNSCAPSQTLADLKVRRIAVLEFSNSTERRTGYFSPPFPNEDKKKEIYRYLDNDGKLAAEAMENALLAGGQVAVVERRELEKVFKEQHLQLTGAIDPKQAVQIGKMAGADAVLLGRVDHAYAGYEGKKTADAWVGTYVPRAAFTLRLVHVESGELVWTCQISRSALNYLEKPLAVDAGKVLKSPHVYDRELLGSVVEERIKNILQATARDAVENLTGSSTRKR